MKKTFKELVEIDSFIGNLYKENKELELSKFGYCYKRFAEKSYYNVLKEYQQKIQDIRIDCALENNDTKAVITDNDNPRGYKYTKEGLKKVSREENKLSEEWDLKEFDIEPFFCKEENIPLLTEGQREKLLGVIIEK
jgi:hypothetical protein